MTMTVEPGSENGTRPGGPAGDDGRVGAAEEELARQLAEQARAEGLSLTGPGGLLGRLTKVVLESALEGEMDAHLGYAKHDRPGMAAGTPATASAPRQCSPMSGRCRSRSRVTGMPRLSRRSWPNGSGGWAGWMIW